MKRIRKKGKSKKNNKIIFLLIILVILTYLIPKYVSFSKYIYNKLNVHYLESKQFYFSSDKLTSAGTSEYEVTKNWSGVQSYSIMVNMYSKKNDMVFAPNDVDYNISCTCSSNITYSLDKTSSTIVGYDNDGVNEDYFIITIDPVAGSDLRNGDSVWIDVNATSTSPYIASLSGRLLVTIGAEDLSYEIADWENSPYLQMDITNKLITGVNVTLSFDPNTVLMDMTSGTYQNAVSTTSQTINGYTYINSVTFYFEPLMSESIKFYKVLSAQNYSYSQGDLGTPVIAVRYTNT